MVTFTINIPPMLAYIYHTWILWVMDHNGLSYFTGLRKKKSVQRCPQPVSSPTDITLKSTKEMQVAICCCSKGSIHIPRSLTHSVWCSRQSELQLLLLEVAATAVGKHWTKGWTDLRIYGLMFHWHRAFWRIVWMNPPRSTEQFVYVPSCTKVLGPIQA